MTLTEARAQVEVAQALFQLSEWRLQVRGPHPKMKDGEIEYFAQDRVANVYIRHEELPDDEVQATAIHEMAHLVLSEVVEVAIAALEQCSPAVRATLERSLDQAAEHATLRIERATMSLLRTGCAT